MMPGRNVIEPPASRLVARRHADLARFGDAALRIRDAELSAARVLLRELDERTQNRRIVTVRQSIAYRVWTECAHLSLSDVAKLIGRADHSSAVHAILAGARARGVEISRVSDLREARDDRVDWVKLAYAAAGWREARGLMIAEAAARAGVGRVEWRKVEKARSVSAGTLLRVCRAVGVDPFVLIVTAVSRETPVEHGGEDAARA